MKILPNNVNMKDDTNQDYEEHNERLIKLYNETLKNMNILAKIYCDGMYKILEEKWKEMYEKKTSCYL